MSADNTLDSNRALTIEIRKISDLKEDPYNSRKHNSENIKAIQKSLERFSQQIPILINTEGVVIAGNGRLQALRELGEETVQVIVTDLSEEEAKAFAIADNKTAELAVWDNEVLQDMLHSLPSELKEAAGFLEQDVKDLVIDDWSPSESEQSLESFSKVESKEESSTHTLIFDEDQWVTVLSAINKLKKDASNSISDNAEALIHMCNLSL